MRRFAALLLACLLVPACGGPSQVRSSVGPGSGYLTRAPAMARSLREGVTVTPILTTGDSLYSNEPGEPPFLLAGRAAGLAVTDRGDGTAEIYVSHEDAWYETFEGGMVSHLVLDLRNAGVLAGDIALEPSRGYGALAHTALLDSRVGFLHPYLAVNERASPTRFPVVAALDLSSETAQSLPWLGAMRHKSTISLPVTSGRLVLVMTGGSTAAGTGRDQLYLYVANTDTDVLTGTGQLYVFRAATSPAAPVGRDASAIQRGLPASGTFAPVDGAAAGTAPELEALVQRLGCLNFSRLEGIAIDRERLNGFYFADRLGYRSGAIIQTGAGAGRVYHALLDPSDPTRVERLEVVADGSDGDDLFRPSGLDTDQNSLMIQEDPGGRGLHPARILRYDLRTRGLEAVAECAERDSRGRPLSSGVGGDWETSGITNVSRTLGEDSWLFTVQAHTLRAPQNGGRWGEAGQVLLLRGSRYPRPEPARQSTTPEGGQ